MHTPSSAHASASGAPDNLIKNPLDRDEPGREERNRSEPDRDRRRDMPHTEKAHDPGPGLITNPLDKPGARDNLIKNPLEKD